MSMTFFGLRLTPSFDLLHLIKILVYGLNFVALVLDITVSLFASLYFVKIVDAPYKGFGHSHMVTVWSFIFS